MNLDLGNLVLIGIIVVAGFLLIKRLMTPQSPYSQQGSNRPQYNDPNISSHGGFGGNNQPQGTSHQQYDDPNIESHGGFGSGGSSVRPSAERSNTPSISNQSAVNEKLAERNRKNDDQNVSSHGGFGGQR